jgi:P-type Cu+ transporter
MDTRVQPPHEPHAVGDPGTAHDHHRHHHGHHHQADRPPAGNTAPAAAPATADAAGAISGTVYTCPMHPEIRQDHPGHCPKCGMTLEPVLPSLDDTGDPELQDFRRRFWWTLPFTKASTPPPASACTAGSKAARSHWATRR